MLQTAVIYYIDKSCSNISTYALGTTWGWPIGTWSTKLVTDMCTPLDSLVAKMISLATSSANAIFVISHFVIIVIIVVIINVVVVVVIIAPG
jgi:hypothetical protein